MKRILFVDDDAMVLDAIRALLRSRRHEWDMHFALGGAAGRDRLDEGGYDVLVTDMRMPEVDGATLLRHARDHHPDVIRFALSGHTEFEVMLRTVSIAHQFLMKPCEPMILRGAIESACALRELLQDPALRALVGRLERIPPTPRVYARLLVALENPRTTGADVAALVEQDIALCVHVLRLANSAFFGPARRVDRVSDAVRLVGTNMTKWLVLSSEAFAGLGVTELSKRLIERTVSHSLHVARVAGAIQGAGGDAENALAASMLHDIGKCVLAAIMPAEYEEIQAASLERAVPLHVVERERLGVSHAEVGAYLIGIWGLPFAITEAVAQHHEPRRVDRTTFDLVGLVHVANALSHSADGVADDRLDMQYLAAVGCLDRLEEWRRTAAACWRPEEGESHDGGI